MIDKQIIAYIQGFQVRNQSVYMHLSTSIRMRPDALGFIAKNCRPMGSAGQKGFICIFCCAENRCFAAIQLAAWILFSNPAANQKCCDQLCTSVNIPTGRSRMYMDSPTD